jgi:RHS repeat-associated protein
MNAALIGSAACGDTAAPAPALTTIYVNKYYEVRDHDAATKYVLEDETRIAQVTGSLSANRRLQRLRVRIGWNLCSLAVTATNALTQLSPAGPLPVLSAAYKWDPQASKFALIADGETLPAGTVLWLKSAVGATLTVVGDYVEPANLNLPATNTFLPSAGLEAWEITRALAPGLSLYKYAPEAHCWQTWLAEPLRLDSPQPGFVAPGEAVFVEAGVPFKIEVPEPALRVLYYHPDHLESTSVVSDGSGRIAEESAYFPFGATRCAVTFETPEPHYTFAQKECDPESSLSCYPARYYSRILGRFLQPDALSANLDAAGERPLLTPQKLTTYAYVRNNPLKYVDPSGMEDTPPPDEKPPAQPPPAQPNLTLPPGSIPAQASPPKVVLTETPQPQTGLRLTVPPLKPSASQQADDAWRAAAGQPSAPPRPGSGGDLAGAVGKLQLNGKSLQDLAIGAVTQPLIRDWEKATPGEKAAAISAGVIMAGTAAVALQNKDALAAARQVVPKIEAKIPLGKSLDLKISVSTSKPEGGITIGGKF